MPTHFNTFHPSPPHSLRVTLHTPLQLISPHSTPVNHTPINPSPPPPPPLPPMTPLILYAPILPCSHLDFESAFTAQNDKKLKAVFLARIHVRQTSRHRQETQISASILTNKLLQCIYRDLSCAQPMKAELTVTWVAWRCWRTLTNGSDVKYVLPRCRSLITVSPACVTTYVTALADPTSAVHRARYRDVIRHRVQCDGHRLRLLHGVRVREADGHAHQRRRPTAEVWILWRSRCEYEDTAKVRFFFACGYLELIQRLLHKMTNSRAVFIARIHAC